MKYLKYNWNIALLFAILNLSFTIHDKNDGCINSNSHSVITDLSCPDNNHPHAIDLGLPSGTKWACCNMDAKSPEEFGGYYAWGEIKEKSNYVEDTYEFYNSSTQKYTNLGKDIAGTKYDVAYMKWGNPWRMPTWEQAQELIDYCTWSKDLVDINGNKGRKVIGPNGCIIFIPASGYKDDRILEASGMIFLWGYIHQINTDCRYWTSTRDSKYINDAIYLGADSANIDGYIKFCFFGHTIRPVCKGNVPSRTNSSAPMTGTTKTVIDGIYYILNHSTRTASVTYTGTGENYKYNPPSTAYTGAIRIPHSVIYKGITYKVTSIGSEAFHNCQELTSIEIPQSVKSIGRIAFVNCIGLTSITIPNSVTFIGEATFYGCTGLTSIVVESGNTHFDSRYDCNAIIETATNRLIKGCINTIIPNNVTTIGNSAFADCKGLKSITIPNSVTEIDNCAFDRCTELTSIIFPNNVKAIGDYAFHFCSGLTSITIPIGVTKIGMRAFSGCNELTSINVENGNTKYDSRDGCNAIIETATNTLIQGCKNTVIPNSVTIIGDNAFEDCTSLTSITIPNRVTAIGWCAFADCSNLTSITIPSSVRKISKSAFYDCRGLKSITIPKSVTEIGESVFKECNNLMEVYSNLENPFVIKDDVFTNYNATLFVPKGTSNLYKARPGWKRFVNIVEFE